MGRSMSDYILQSGITSTGPCHYAVTVSTWIDMHSVQSVFSEGAFRTVRNLDEIRFQVAEPGAVSPHR